MLTSLTKEEIKIATGLPTGTHIGQSIICWLPVRPARGRLVAKQPPDPGQPHGHRTRSLPCHSCQPSVPLTKTFYHPQGEKNTITQRKMRKTFLQRAENIGCGTYIIRLLFGLYREVLLVGNQRSRELLHFKALGSLLLPSEDVWLGRGEKGVKWRSWGSHGSVGAVWGLKAWAGGIPLLVLSLNILC